MEEIVRIALFILFVQDWLRLQKRDFTEKEKWINGRVRRMMENGD